MRIVQVAAEVAPMAKVGGLSDVMMGLNRELVAQGHNVDIIVPKYDILDKSYQLECIKPSLRSFFQGAWYENSLWKTKKSDFTVHFLESRHPSLFFDRGCIYGCHDDIDRFLYFSRAVIDLLVALDDVPDIIHIHDWMTAAIAPLIRQGEYKARFEKTRIVFTIHNIAYQGKCSVPDLDKIGLRGAWFEAPQRMQEDFGQALSLLKGGIVFSDHTTTVSETYAKEVLTPEGGMGMHLTLQKNQARFCGILNGLDYTYWNPAEDPLIESPFTSHDLLLKEKNKEVLRTFLGLTHDPKKPLAAVVTRLVHQKGIDLIRHALKTAHEKEMQMVVLGIAPDPALNWEFATLQGQLEKDPDVRILLQQEELLAHRLYAAADMFLVPSIFEPCGLTQLIALRYGSIPVVRKTGGLADTVFDVDFSGLNFDATNGFSFDHPNPEGLDSALTRALLLYRSKPERWKQLVRQAMACDYSWRRSALLYTDIYNAILKKSLHTVDY